MSLEQALLDRLEKRSLQIAQQHNEINGLRELVDEKMAINEQLAEQITNARLEREQMQHQIAELRTECDRIREISKSLVPKSALKQAVQEAAELHAEVVKLRAEVPLESTREALKNAVANMHELTKEKDRMRLQLENARADLKQALVERDSLGTMAADRALEIRKLMDGHAEDMKAQAELQSKYESLLTKITDLGSYAMTLGRKEGEPLGMFMERQALRLAALESTITAKCDELAKETAKIKPLEALYKTLKGWQENDHIIGYGLTIDTAINKATEALSQLTA
jgi:chromosome segregation ATPase